MYDFRNCGFAECKRKACKRTAGKSCKEKYSVEERKCKKYGVSGWFAVPQRGVDAWLRSVFEK